MDISKVITRVEGILDRIEQKLDSKDSTSVWATTTRVGGTEIGSIALTAEEFKFLVELAEEHDLQAIKRYGKYLRDRYLSKPNP